MQTLIKTLVTHRVKPFVIVVTPTWNRGAFLPYLLYMYRYQDYPADRRLRNLLQITVINRKENNYESEYVLVFTDPR